MKLYITASIDDSPLKVGFEADIPNKYGRMIIAGAEVYEAVKKGVDTIEKELKEDDGT